MREHALPIHALQQLVYNAGNAMTEEDELSEDYLLDLLPHEPNLFDTLNTLVVVDAATQLRKERARKDRTRDSEDSILRPSVLIVNTRNSDYTEAREAMELIEVFYV